VSEGAAVPLFYYAVGVRGRKMLLKFEARERNKTLNGLSVSLCVCVLSFPSECTHAKPLEMQRERPLHANAFNPSFVIISRNCFNISSRVDGICMSTQ
jgi:hypothetical protein